MFGYFCNAFIAFMLKGKSFLDCTNLFILTNIKRMIKQY